MCICFGKIPGSSCFDCDRCSRLSVLWCLRFRVGLKDRLSPEDDFLSEALFAAEYTIDFTGPDDPLEPGDVSGHPAAPQLFQRLF